jgi:hypothetical protein
MTKNATVEGGNLREGVAAFTSDSVRDQPFVSKRLNRWPP